MAEIGMLVVLTEMKRENEIGLGIEGGKMCIGEWLYGGVVVWLCGCMGVLLCGSGSVWLCGCVAVWLSGCVWVFRVWVFGV